MTNNHHSSLSRHTREKHAFYLMDFHASFEGVTHFRHYRTHPSKAGPARSEANGYKSKCYFLIPLKWTVAIHAQG